MQRVFLEEQLIDFKITLFPSGEAEPSTTLTENILRRTFVAGYFLSVLVWTSDIFAWTAFCSRNSRQSLRALLDPHCRADKGTG